MHFASHALPLEHRQHNTEHADVHRTEPIGHHVAGLSWLSDYLGSLSQRARNIELMLF